MKWILILASFWISFKTHATEDISAIVSHSRTIITIKDVDRVDYESFKNVSVLSEKGNHHSWLVFDEDNFKQAEFFSVIVKDENGEVVARYSKKDFKQTAVIEAVYSYGAVNRFHLDCGLNRYPYSIETHSLFRSNIFLGAVYDLSEDEGTLLLKSSFEVVYPDDYKLRYQINRSDLVLVDSLTQKKESILNFKLNENFKSSAEPYMPYIDRPIVIIVPEVFKYGKILGSLNSWQEYGAWMNTLWYGRNELSKPTTEAIDALIIANPDTNDLVKAIYKYTQQNMRYVLITLGLGGFQTMSAKETAKLGYGDCKALTNFTAAAMNYAGIDAYPALIYGGERSLKVDPNMPRFSFNHVILCIPANGDTTWLECTDNSGPYGYMSDFTDDRYALILKPTGGELAKTPAYSYVDNETVRRTNMILNVDGSASIQLNCNYKNLAMENSNFYRREFTGDKPIKAVKRELSLPSFDLESFTSELYKNQEPRLDVNCTLEARNVGRRVGDKLLVKPFINQTAIPGLEADTARIHPVFFKHGYTYSDTISIVLPAEMTVLEPLQEMEESTKFGELSMRINLDLMEGKIEIVRHILLNSGEYNPEEYSELISFLDKLRESENCFFILQ